MTAIRFTLRGVMTAWVLLLSLDITLAQSVPQTEPYRVSGEVTRPEKISGSPPVYTELARKARVVGVVIVEVVINEKGDVVNSRVLKGLPMGLDKASLDAVEAWKFKPSTLNGVPVKVYYTLTVNFQLDVEISFGPAFGEFRRMHPDFAQRMGSRRFDEALELLDQWTAESPNDPRLRLSRVYVLTAKGSLEEAWEEAQPYDGPDSYELYYFLGVNAQGEANGEPDSARRADLVELALRAEDQALTVRPEDTDALAIKSLLLQHKASLLSDDNEDAVTLRAEAVQLQRRVAELRSSREEMTFPEKISGEPAELTEEARKAKISGTVTIEAVIDEQGDIVEARVVKGLPMGLDQVALDTVRTWKFKPATSGGKPIKVAYTVMMTFR